MHAHPFVLLIIFCRRCQVRAFGGVGGARTVTASGGSGGRGGCPRAAGGGGGRWRNLHFSPSRHIPFAWNLQGTFAVPWPVYISLDFGPSCLNQQPSPKWHLSTRHIVQMFRLSSCFCCGLVLLLLLDLLLLLRPFSFCLLPSAPPSASAFAFAPLLPRLLLLLCLPLCLPLLLLLLLFCLLL